MGRVTYLHQCVRIIAALLTRSYLPTLWFAVLMLGLLFDHFVFSARRWSEGVKSGVFLGMYALVVGVAWWFRGAAFGFDGACEAGDPSDRRRADTRSQVPPMAIIGASFERMRAV